MLNFVGATLCCKLGVGNEHEAVPAAAAVAVADASSPEVGTTVWTEATVVAEENETAAATVDGATASQGVRLG